MRYQKLFVNVALTVSKIKILWLTKTTATKFLKNFLPERGAPSELMHKEETNKSGGSNQFSARRRINRRISRTLARFCSSGMKVIIQEKLFACFAPHERTFLQEGTYTGH